MLGYYLWFSSMLYQCIALFPSVHNALYARRWQKGTLLATLAARCSSRALTSREFDSPKATLLRNIISFVMLLTLLVCQNPAHHTAARAHAAHSRGRDGSTALICASRVSCGVERRT